MSGMAWQSWGYSKFWNLWMFILVELQGMKPPWSPFTNCATTLLNRFANIFATIFVYFNLRNWSIRVTFKRLFVRFHKKINASHIDGGRTPASHASVNVQKKGLGNCLQWAYHSAGKPLRPGVSSADSYKCQSPQWRWVLPLLEWGRDA